MKTSISNKPVEMHRLVHSTVVAASLHNMRQKKKVRELMNSTHLTLEEKEQIKADAKKERVSVRSLVRDRLRGKETPIDSIAEAIEQELSVP